MSTGESLYVVVVLDDFVDGACSTAIGVANENAVVAAPVAFNGDAKLVSNLLLPIVQPRIQAFEVQMAPAVVPLQGPDFPGQGTTRYDQNGLCHMRSIRALISRGPSSADCDASRQYASAPIALPNCSFSGAPPTITM